MLQSHSTARARTELAVPPPVRTGMLVIAAGFIVVAVCWLAINRSFALAVAPALLLVLGTLALRPYWGAVGLLLYSTVHFFVARVIFHTGNNPSLLIDTGKDFFLLVVFAVWSYQHKGKPFSAIPRGVFVAMAVYATITLVEAFNPLGFGFKAAFTDFRWTTLSLIFALIVAGSLRSARALRVTLGLLVGMAVLQAIYGIFQQTLSFKQDVALGADPGLGGSFFLGHVLSFGAVGGAFGPYLAMVLPFVVAWLITAQTWWQRVLALAACALLLVAIVDSSVRVSWVMTAIGIITTCLATRRWLLLALAFAAGLTFATLTSGYTAHRLHAVLDPLGRSSTLRGRTIAWAGNYQLVFEYPLGFGLGTTGDTRYRQGVTAVANIVPPFTENEWLDLGLEIGLPGIAAFAWMLVAVVRASVEVRRQLIDPWLCTVWAASFSVVVMCLVAGIDARTITGAAPVSWYFWASIGVLFALPRIHDGERVLPTLIHSGGGEYATSR